MFVQPPLAPVHPLRRTPRHPPSSWPDTNGYLGKPTDPDTGLTTIGARTDDPALGRFTSPDPILDPSQPQTLNGYTYAADNPTTRSDPTGLMLAGGAQCGMPGAAARQPPPASLVNATFNQATSGCVSGMCTMNVVHNFQKPTYTAHRVSQYLITTAVQQASTRAYLAEQAKKRAQASSGSFSWDSIWGGVTHTWDSATSAVQNVFQNHWRQLLEAAAFGACLVATAGACFGIGIVVATVEFGASAYDTGGVTRGELKDYVVNLMLADVGFGAGKFTDVLWKGLAEPALRAASGPVIGLGGNVVAHLPYQRIPQAVITNAKHLYDIANNLQFANCTGTNPLNPGSSC